MFNIKLAQDSYNYFNYKNLVNLQYQQSNVGLDSQFIPKRLYKYNLICNVLWQDLISNLWRKYYIILKVLRLWIICMKCNLTIHNLDIHHIKQRQDQLYIILENLLNILLYTIHIKVNYSSCNHIQNSQGPFQNMKHMYCKYKLLYQNISQSHKIEQVCMYHQMLGSNQEYKRNRLQVLEQI